MVCAPEMRGNLRALKRGLSLRTGAQTMLYLTCTMISSVDFAYYRVSRAKDWVHVSVDCGTRTTVVIGSGVHIFEYYGTLGDKNALISNA